LVASASKVLIKREYDIIASISEEINFLDDSSNSDLVVTVL